MSFSVLDKNIKYHKYVGYVIAFFSVVHTLAHLGNYIFAVFHLFYIVFWFTLLCHGPKFWCWLVVPASNFTV
uniref:Ferric oxidoreductase domain-containing protein n=1 Tax=Tetranychus urticae TaxID=32264 RepID=T1JR16_TETUR